MRVSGEDLKQLTNLYLNIGKFFIFLRTEFSAFMFYQIIQTRMVGSALFSLVQNCRFGSCSRLKFRGINISLSGAVRNEVILSEGGKRNANRCHSYIFFSLGESAVNSTAK